MCFRYQEIEKYIIRLLGKSYMYIVEVLYKRMVGRVGKLSLDIL